MIARKKLNLNWIKIMNNSKIDREKIEKLATYCGFEVSEDNFHQFIYFYMLCKGDVFREMEPLFDDFREFTRKLRSVDDAAKAINKSLQ